MPARIRPPSHDPRRPKRAGRRQSAIPASSAGPKKPELVIITGLSGSGKATVLKSFEDLGYYSVDNLPIDLIPKFAELIRGSPSVRGAALVVDIREGAALDRFPALYRKICRLIPTTLVFLEADSQVLARRYSETRRPHPLGTRQSVIASIEREREELAPIRGLAEPIVDTTRFNVHELRELIGGQFRDGHAAARLMVSVTSFGYRHGLPAESDLVFDVRFLPNPNYIPHFKNLTGRHPGVARYIRSFPQTVQFIERVSELLVYLLPHYIREGKSYLTISFGCTGGKHRSVMIAGEVRKRLVQAGFRVKCAHRDVAKG